MGCLQYQNKIEDMFFYRESGEVKKFCSNEGNPVKEGTEIIQEVERQNLT